MYSLSVLTFYLCDQKPQTFHFCQRLTSVQHHIWIAVVWFQRFLFAFWVFFNSYAHKNIAYLVFVRNLPAGHMFIKMQHTSSSLLCCISYAVSFLTHNLMRFFFRVTKK